MFPAIRAATLAVTVGVSLTLVATAPTQVAAAAKPPKPVITKVSPQTGPTAGGTVVTIKGKNLKTATKVLFGSAKGLKLTVKSDRKLKVTAPPHAEGTVDVKVKTKGGKSGRASAARFTFVAPTPPPTPPPPPPPPPSPPTVTGVSPGSGPISGGTPVTVTGTNLTGATSVTFGGTAATGLTPGSSTSLTVTSPAHAAGQVDVRVTTSAGTSAVVAADQFVYQPPSMTPTVTEVSPPSGPDTGNSSVTVRGTNLNGATSVSFGGTPGTNLIQHSPTELVVTSPVHAAGLVHVVVTTPAGTSSPTVDDQFEFLPVPSVSAGSLPPDADTDPGVSLNAVSCPATQMCFAVGSYLSDGLRKPLIETRTGRNTWVGTSPLIPADQGEGNEVDLVDIDCASATLCVAVGTYFDDSPTPQYLPLIETWNGTDWIASSADLPADSGFTTDALLSDVDCVAATATCVAVGRYDTTVGDILGLALTRSGAGWSAAGIPGAVDSQAQLYAVDCPAAATCVAVGEETASGGQTVPFVATGPATWTVDASVELPDNADDSDPQVELRQVSCLSAGGCVAAGSYRTDDAATQGFLEIQGGGWTAVEAAAPDGADPDPELNINGLSCSGSCAAVGNYLVGGDSRPLLVTISGLTANVVRGEVPPDGTGPGGSSTTVTCGGVERCVGVGHYELEPDVRAPFLSHLTGTDWLPSAGPAPLDVADLVQPGASSLDGSVVVAVGSYFNSDGELQPLLMVDLPFEPPV